MESFVDNDAAVRLKEELEQFNRLADTSQFGKDVVEIARAAHYEHWRGRIENATESYIPGKYDREWDDLPIEAQVSSLRSSLTALYKTYDMLKSEGHIPEGETGDTMIEDVAAAVHNTWREGGLGETPTRAEAGDYRSMSDADEEKDRVYARLAFATATAHHKSGESATPPQEIIDQWQARMAAAPAQDPWVNGPTASQQP